MSFSDHLMILQVIVPLMAAPLCLLSRRGVFAWSLATVISWLTFAIAVALLIKVQTLGTQSYDIGGWQAPMGIEYKLDMLGAILLVLISAIGAVVMPYAKASVEKEIPADRIYLFYTMMLLCEAGLLGIAITGDAFNLFVFLEISALSSYVLISLGKDKRALTAAFRYLIIGTIGATFYIIGVGLMYMMTGTLNIADLAERIPEVIETRTILVALGFLTVGLSLKIALFPLHAWLPNAYTYAPSVVTAFLAATATKVSIYALLRVIFTIFGGVNLFETFPIQPILMGLALSGMFAASLVAVWQTDVKRMLAYSSIAQIGYMILGVSLATTAGLAGGIVHIFNHGLMKGALFLAVGAMVLRIGSSKIEALQGLGKRMPMTSAAFLFSGLSLIGVPLTVGFISKWALLQASLEIGYWPIAALILMSSLLAVIYVWRVIEVLYMRQAPANAAAVSEAPMVMLLSMWTLTAASLYFGINATLTLDLATQAAVSLMGGN